MQQRRVNNAVWRRVCAVVAVAVVAMGMGRTVAVAQDTVVRLSEVEVSSQRPPSTMRTATPTQVVDAERIERMGAVQLSDAVKQMAGVVLKDYGGVGGMKTVSARGLGSQFSTLTIDGVAVDNSQNGQVDLGRYMVGNAAYVSLSHGQAEEQLLSAKAYAAGNVISMESAEPVFFLTQKNNYKLQTDVGSFGMFSPSALWEHKWGARLKSSLWANYLKSDGNYPFTLYYTASHADSSSRERRSHSAMHMFTADGALFATLGQGNTLTGRVHYTRGMHQLPGEVVQYRTYPSRQSTHEEQAFAQLRWRVERNRWKAQLLGKVQTSYDQYQDSAAMGYANSYLENHYRQTEGYLSGSAVATATDWADVGLSADASAVRLQSNLAYRNNVLRQSGMAVLTARLHRGAWEARAHLLGTECVDHVADLDTMPRYARLSPYLSLRWALGERLTVRYFYKENFRVPTFSELYMFYSIPKQLRPEKARQHNVGVTYMGQWVSGTIDAYYNRVQDKIVAMPGTNMFYWTMDNLGQVRIVGVDATADAQWGNISVHATYSFAHAVDVSDPTNPKTYGHQIRYTPRHSGGGSVRWQNSWVNLAAQAMVVGHRYAMPQNSISYRMPAYCDITLGADREVDLPWGTLQVRLMVMNALDARYEVVKDYPMMGRNYRISLTYQL